MSGASTSTSSPGLSAPISRRAPSSPSRRMAACEQAPAQKHRIAAPAFAQRGGGERALARKEAADQGVDELRLDPGHVAEEHERARDIAAPSPRDRPCSEEARPLANCGLKAIATSRPASAASTALRAWPVTTTTGRAPRRERRLRDTPHDRLAVELRDELRRVPAAAGAKARRLACGEHDGADLSHRARAAADATRSPSEGRRRPSRGCPRRGSARRPARAAEPSRSRSPWASGRSPARR